MESMVSPAQRRGWVVTAMLGAFLLCVVAYLPALGGTYLFDDTMLLKIYDCWHGLKTVPAMFGFGEPNPCAYRPVRFLTYALDYEIGGLDPLVIHISNLVYHLLTTVAVFFVFRRWASDGAAVLMMALWALHPVHTDAVAYMSGRRDVVSTLLFLLAFIALLPPAGKRLTVLRVLLGGGLFYLSIRAKEMTVTLPAVLVWAVISDYAGRWSELKAHFKRRWPVYLLLFAGAMAFVIHRAIFKSHSNMEDNWWGGSPVSNFATVFSLYVRYLWLVIWPDRLIGDYFGYTIPGMANFAQPMVILGILLYVAILALIVVSLRRGWRATAFGLGWFLITMLPVSHIFPHHELFAEHYLYLPMIGLAAALLPVAQRLLSSAFRKRRLAFLCVTAVLLGALTARTADRAADYQSGLTFYSKAHELAPYNIRITYNLGLTYLQMDECEQAVPLLIRAAERIRRGHPLSRQNLTAFLNCSERLGRSDLVDTLLRELLRRHPMDPLGLSWHGRRLLERGYSTEAAYDLNAAVRMTQGRDVDTVAMLAMALTMDGRPQEALDVLRRYPWDDQQHCEQEVNALINLGVDHYSEAFRRAHSCLLRYPDSLLLLEFRAALFYSSGHPELAEPDLRHLEELGAGEEVLERVRALRGLRR